MATYYWRIVVDFGVSGLRHEVVDIVCDFCRLCVNFLDMGR